MTSTLNEHSQLLEVLIANTANIPGKQYIPLGDGTYIEVDGNHKTLRKP